MEEEAVVLIFVTINQGFSKVVVVNNVLSIPEDLKMVDHAQMYVD
jgi:hypothetical protein